MTTLARLSEWYQAHCNGDWEHQQGIRIETLDNPGWSVTINLAGTELSDVAFETFEDSYEHDTNWLRCWREGSDFRAACGPQRLGAVIERFLDWARRYAHSA